MRVAAVLLFIAGSACTTTGAAASAAPRAVDVLAKLLIAAYAARDAGFAQKNVGKAYIYCAPSCTFTPYVGPARNLQKEMASLNDQLKRVISQTRSTSVVNIMLKGKQAVVLNVQHVTIDGRQNATATHVDMMGDKRDVWQLMPKGWQMVSSTVVAERLIVDGKLVKLK